MKILFILPSYNCGGAETHTHDLATQLTKLGHRVDVICCYGDFFSNRNYNLIHEPLATFFQKIKSIVNDYDIIHLHAGLTVEEIKELKKIRKIYVTLHGDWSALTYGDLIDDNFVAITVNGSVQRLKPVKMKVSFNGVTSKLAPPTIYITSRIDEGKLGVIDAIIELIKENKIPYKVKVLGSGYQLDKYKEKTKDIKSKIEFMGATDKIQYNRQDIVIGVARAFLEGIASGCRCIMANDKIYMGNNPFEDQEKNNFNAYNCERVTKENLLTKLTELINEPQLTRYTSKAMTDDYLELWGIKEKITIEECQKIILETRTEINSYYSQYMLAEQKFWKHLPKWIIETNATDVVDIGCAYGTLALYTALNKDIGVDCIDNIKYMSDKLVTKYPLNYKILNFETEQLEDKKYDLIIFSEIFEHLDLNPIESFTRLKNILKDNGKILFSTPNAKIWGRKTTIYNHWNDMPHEVWCSVDSHKYHYTLEELTDIFNQVQLKVTKFKMSGGNFNMMLTK